MLEILITRVMQVYVHGTASKHLLNRIPHKLWVTFGQLSKTPCVYIPIPYHTVPAGLSHLLEHVHAVHVKSAFKTSANTQLTNQYDPPPWAARLQLSVPRAAAAAFNFYSSSQH